MRGIMSGFRFHSDKPINVGYLVNWGCQVNREERTTSGYLAWNLRRTDVGVRVRAMGGAGPCIFCQIARSSTSTQLLYSDEKVVAFQDINPSAFKHYLVIPVEHIPTVRDLHRRTEDYQLVSHMLEVGQTLLRRDAPDSNQYRFGFHQPPLNSVNHLHLHCLALPFIPKWKCIKYTSLGPFGGFIKAEKLLQKIKPKAFDQS